MQEKKPPYKIISIICFAVAAIFLVMSIFIGIKYTPAPQKLSKKVVNAGKEEVYWQEDSTSYSVDEVESDFDSFTITKDGTAISAVDVTASGAADGTASGAADGTTSGALDATASGAADEALNASQEAAADAATAENPDAAAGENADAQAESQ